MKKHGRPHGRNGHFARLFLSVRHNGYHPHIVRERALIAFVAVIALAEIGFLAPYAVFPGVPSANALTGFVGTHFALSAKTVGALLLGVFALMGAVVGLGLVSSARRFPPRALVGGATIAVLALGVLLMNFNYFSGVAVPSAGTASSAAAR
ncbi:MAG: hypothetical protein KGI41_01910 [Patescibacteria group bacterium]|nr:hypothetical protein [Patescibacteria group bacterium]